MADKYEDLVDEMLGDLKIPEVSQGVTFGVHLALRWLDDHRDQAPGRTITESDFKRAARSNQIGDSFGCYRGFLADLGVATIPDPEPTNAEKIEVALTRLPWLGKDERRSIAEQLDISGVKATTNQEKS